MRTATSTRELEAYYARRAEADRRQEAIEAQLAKACAPLVEAWGVDKYNDWVDQFIDDDMTIPQIISTMQAWYPAPSIPACYGL